MCPTAATAPASTIRRIACQAAGPFGGQGDHPDRAAPAARTRSSSAGSGSRSADSSWAPQRSAASQGPSRWIPATSPVAPARPARAPGQQLGRVRGDQRGDHRRGAVPAVQLDGRRGAPPISAGSVAGNAPPPPPCTWMSTNPGTTVTAPRRRPRSWRDAGPDSPAAAPCRRRSTPAAAVPAGDDGVGGDQHAGVPVAWSGLSVTGRLRCPARPAWPGRSPGSSRRAAAGWPRAVQQHRGVRVMLQDRGRPQRADRPSAR